MYRRVITGMAAVGAAVLVLAACGGSSGQGGGASGTPIVIGNITTDKAPGFDNSGIGDGFDAWAAQLNAQGGINGRPVQVDRCNDEVDAAKSQACAQQMISNEDVVAIGGGLGILNEPIVVPAAEKAGLPYIPAFALGGAEYTSDTAFIASPGLLAAFVGIPQYMVTELGCKNVSLIRFDSPSTVPLADLSRAAAAAVGGSLVADIAVPGDTADFLPYVTQANRAGSACMLNGLPLAAIPSLISAIQSSGLPIVVGTQATGLDPATQELAKSAGVKFVMSTDFPDLDDSFSKYPDFVAAMQAQGKSPSLFALLGYQTGNVVAGILAEASKGGDPTRESVLAAIRSGSFTVPPWAGTLSRANAPAQYPAVAELSTYYLQLDSTGLSYLTPTPVKIPL